MRYDSKRPRIIMLADGQSFYASVEKAARPEYRDRPVVVAGDPARRTGIVLAACPLAKRAGVASAERLGEALNKCPGLVVIRPRMAYYLEVAMQITAIFESYTDLVEPYSIDEQFLDVTGTVRLFGGDALEMARRIQRKERLHNSLPPWTRPSGRFHNRSVRLRSRKQEWRAPQLFNQFPECFRGMRDGAVPLGFFPASFRDGNCDFFLWTHLNQRILW
jgi:hypothetical protein